ncbi:MULTISPECIES: hypothetical protein [unclassified Streptomyces]|jgi:hypothetical protein|uniref:hypothetical protein n=1 Tax=unclassified Streptomyces TaxID=2593676 RepID=UPI00081B5914|nr:MULTISPECIES: hypothetical protein [unclassified Streptomyces]MYQ87210.1 hypothetical protein [Streptomyces sp. SID4936]SCE43007.1 hypothetical protein GA0115234_108462 [Streptomyces sp. DvalAA-43]
MPICFAIGPNGDAPAAADGPAHDIEQRSTVFYEEVVRPVCERLGMTLVRAEYESGAGPLSDRSIRHLIDDDLVIADLTRVGPEVVYGLGVRHTTGRRTVHLCEAGTAPFAAGVLPTIEYPALPLGSAEARQALMTTLSEGPLGEGLLGGGPLGGSPLLPAARVPLPGAAGGEDPATALAPASASAEEDDPGLWDRVVAAETAMEAIVDDMAEVDAALVDLAAMGELLNEDMVRAGLPGTPMSARMAVLNRFAKAIEGPADELEAASGRFVERMRITADALSAFLQWARVTPREEWPDEVDELLGQVIGMARDVRESAADVQGVEPVIEMLGMASRRLRRPSRKIGASLRAMFTSLAMFDEWESTARELKRS